MRRLRKYWVWFLLGVFTVALCGCDSSNSGDLITTVRTTQFGAVQGIVQLPGTNSVLTAGEGFAWLGVPYAKPPVGDLRWKPPVDPDPWTGIKKTQQFCQACSQVGSMYGPPAYGSAYETAANVFWKPVGSEDCLYMNIYSPITSGPGSKLPVFFFIHGGSNRVGAASLFDGSVLAKNTNSVVVVVGYRLNLFGWLTHPALRTGEPLNDSGNYGLLDLIKALQFVKNNINNFGGDPDNVTISGQSAGALNVNALILSPVAASLFHKAMPMSGDTTGSTVAAGETASALLVETFLIKDGLATDHATAVAFLAGKDNAWIASYLRGKSTTDIINIMINPTGGKFGNGAYTTLGSIAANFGDGYVCPVNSAAAITAGNYNKVPMIIGNTTEEGKLFAQACYKISDMDRFNLMMNFDPANPGTLSLTDILDPAVVDPPTAAQYNILNNVWPSPVNALPSALYIYLMDILTKNYKATSGAPVYAYSFEWANQPEPWKTLYGAVHAGDLGWVFGDFDRKYLFSEFNSPENKPGRIALSNAMQQALGAFMRTGDPNPADPAILDVTWPQSETGTDGNPKKIKFDATLTDKKISLTNN
jgi:para-nitrobenzyl esterase